jgi:hypothetical protein
MGGELDLMMAVIGGAQARAVVKREESLRMRKRGDHYFSSTITNFSYIIAKFKCPHPVRMPQLTSVWKYRCLPVITEHEFV